MEKNVVILSLDKYEEIRAKESTCKKQVKTIIFRQFISSTFRQLKTSTFISALYPSREQISRGYFFIT